VEEQRTPGSLRWPETPGLAPPDHRQWTEIS
jgi:hypothetical protein